MQTLKIKPLSVNEAWQGRRFKTPQYDSYIQEVIWSLKPITLPEPPFLLKLKAGLSSSASDIDNILKPFIDCLQKKYRFDDKLIHKIEAEKCKVKKGQEFIEFEILSHSLT